MSHVIMEPSAYLHLKSHLSAFKQLFTSLKALLPHCLKFRTIAGRQTNKQKTKQYNAQK